MSDSGCKHLKLVQKDVKPSAALEIFEGHIMYMT